jgi:pyruvate,orthophosphate dikinase
VGLGASPGRVSGRVVLSSDEAGDADDDVILVRPHTSPEDVAGMAASVGILTSTGGLVSHAAVVARGWHLPAVVGAKELRLTAETMSVGDVVLRAGDVITIDGTTGEVWAGDHCGTDTEHEDDDALFARLPELRLIEAWAAEAATGH